MIISSSSLSVSPAVSGPDSGEGSGVSFRTSFSGSSERHCYVNSGVPEPKRTAAIFRKKLKGDWVTTQTSPFFRIVVIWQPAAAPLNGAFRNGLSFRAQDTRAAPSGNPGNTLCFCVYCDARSPERSLQVTALRALTALGRASLSSKSHLLLCPTAAVSVRIRSIEACPPWSCTRFIM